MPTDTTSLKISVDSRGVKIADKNLNDLSKTSSKAEGATNKLTTATSKLNVQNILTAAAVYKLSSEFIKLSDTYSNMNSRLKLVTKDSKDLADTQQSLFEIAQKSRSGYEGTVELYAKIARSTKSLNLESSELLRITETINKTGIISGGSATSIDASLTQLGQAFASGTLRGEELNSVLEQTPRLAQAIADGMGVQVGALRSIAAEGRITSEVLVNALQSQAGAVDEEFKRIKLTISGASVTAGNAILDMVGELNDVTGASTSIAESISDLGKMIEDNSEAAVKAISSVYDVTVSLAVGVAGAMLAVKAMAAAEVIANAIRAESVVITTAYDATLMRTNTTTKILTASQTAAALATSTLNRAMKAVPFIAVASGLALIAAELMDTSKEVEWLGDKFDEAALKAKEFTKAQATFELEKLTAMRSDLQKEFRELQREKKGSGGIWPSFTSEDAARMAEISKQLKEIGKAAKGLQALDDKPIALTIGKVKSASEIKADEEARKLRKKHLEDMAELEEDYNQTLIENAQKTAEQRLEGLDREALQTFNYYDNLMIKYAEVAGAEETLRQLQSEAIDEIIVKMKEQDEAFENTKAIDALDAINDRYQKILDSQIAIAENGMNIDFDLDGVAKDLNNVSKAIQSMHVGSLKYTKEDIKLQNNYAKAYLAAGKDIEKQAKAESEFNADQATLKESRQNAEMAGYASLAGAMASAFEQGSKGAIAFTALQSALGIASSWTAIAQAWALPFPANIPAAAMVASQVMPIIGQLGGSSGGGSGGASAPDPYETKAKEFEDNTQPILSRLDSQIDLLQKIEQQGTAAQYSLDKAGEDFKLAMNLKALDVAKTAKSGVYDTSDYGLGNVIYNLYPAMQELGKALTEKYNFSAIASSIANGDRDLYYSFKGMFDTQTELFTYIANRTDIEAMASQFGGIMSDQTFNNMIAGVQTIINEFASAIGDSIAEMSDMKDTFAELYDSVSGSQKYQKIELINAQKDVNNLLRSSGLSYEGYLESHIKGISDLEKDFGISARKLLYSLDPKDVEAQAELMLRLQETTNQVFSNGVEEALNFLDSIELVGEALANSAENTTEYLDSFKTEDQLTKELAQTLGVTLANSFDELDLLFKRLSLSGGLLTDAELELLSANKALIDTNAADYINDLSNSLGQLEPIANTLRSTINNLRASSMTSEQNLASFYEAINEATKLSTSGSYEDFATAVQKATSLSSVLNNAENFSLSRDMDFAKLVAANQFENLESMTLKEIDYLRMIVENTDPLKEASTSYGFGGATSAPSIAQSVVNPNLSGAYVQNDNVNVVSALTNQNVLLNAIITKQDTQITILRESRDIQNGSLVVLENIEAVS